MSSPFTPVLGTNYAPNDKEVGEIQALLVEPTRQLHRLDVKIAAMQKALDKLVEERDRLGAYVDGHTALISPVRRLPLDIIQEIFIACMPTHRNRVMSAREAPVLLGRICNAWRAIPLSTPRLWSRLHIVEPTRPFSSSLDALFQAKWAQRLEITKTWLGRSGQCPLSISLDGHLDHGNTMHVPDSPVEGHQDTSPFLAALIPFAPRWQHISFIVTSAALEALAALSSMDVPTLQSLTLSQHQDSGFRQLDWARFGILGGDRVSSFSMFGNDFRVAELPLRWDLLTTLTLLGPTRVENPSITSEIALQTISRCPALRNCTLRVEEQATDIPAPGLHRIVEHPSIETLEIWCVGTAVGDTFQRFLGNLSLPALHNFAIRVYSSPLPVHSYAPDAIQCLCRFLASSIQLGSLDIDTAKFSKLSLGQILCHLPRTLRRLYMNDAVQDPRWAWDPTVSCGLDDDILNVLPTALCGPTLLDLGIQYSNQIFDVGLLQFITSMTTSQSRPTLQRVHVRFSRVMQLDIMPLIQEVIESGLEVSITHLPPVEVHFSPWQGLPDYPQISTDL
ncbi:hypothetical protein FB451DRAFT_1133882 [Mycena latifolia]|nr:hypothetical protein FB451DRAFT_1133882 [Mycena latifolia]